jgi:hypothetical protein
MTSSVTFGMSFASRSAIDVGRNGSCAPATTAVGCTRSLSLGAIVAVSAGSSARRCSMNASRPSTVANGFT